MKLSAKTKSGSFSAIVVGMAVGALGVLGDLGDLVDVPGTVSDFVDLCNRRTDCSLPSPGGLPWTFPCIDMGRKGRYMNRLIVEFVDGGLSSFDSSSGRDTKIFSKSLKILTARSAIRSAQVFVRPSHRHIVLYLWLVQAFCLIMFSCVQCVFSGRHRATSSTLQTHND